MIAACRRALLRWERTPRSLRVVAALAWMATIWWASSRPATVSGPGVMTVLMFNAAHVFLFGGLAFLLRAAMSPAADVSRRAAAAIAIASVWGITDELHQSFVPGRVCSALDVVTDVVGAVLFVALADAVAGSRRAAIVAAVTAPLAVLAVVLATVAEG